MNKRALARIVVLTLAAFAAQTAWSPTARALQHMRAVKCCAENCKDPHYFTSASRCGCCQMTSAPQDLSFTSNDKRPLETNASAVLPSSPVLLSTASAPVPQLVTQASLRAAPVFLLTLNIRR